MDQMEPIWGHFGHLFLWEGSPEPDSLGVRRRLLQSLFKVERSTLSLKLPFFSRISGRDRKIFRRVFLNLR
ncbi:MAG: hypothetical protein DRQ24_10820 [Candidatus Latescibacterota bacterium]|nr:MAG: hypothetical protein DRQ24_10820 [Candidatus Latescibacterota bacterium]